MTQPLIARRAGSQATSPLSSLGPGPRASLPFGAEHRTPAASPIPSGPPASAAARRRVSGRAWPARGPGAPRCGGRWPSSARLSPPASTAHWVAPPPPPALPRTPRSRSPGPPWLPPRRPRRDSRRRDRRRPREPGRRPRTGRPRACENRSWAVRGWSVERLLVAVGEPLGHVRLGEVRDRHVVAEDLRRRGQLIGPRLGLPYSGADQRLGAMDERRLHLDANAERRERAR